MVGDATPEMVALFCIRKQAKEAMKCKSVSSFRMYAHVPVSGYLPLDPAMASLL